MGVRVKIAGWSVAFVSLLCVQTRACHVQIHYTKAEIDAAEIRRYESDMRERDRDITGFDARHGLLGEVLGSQQIFEQELQAWKSHTDQFELEHPSLWRVIEGDLLFHKKHPFDPSVVVVPSGLLHPGDPSDPVITPAGLPGRRKPGFPPIHPAVVPEPSSGVLGLMALTIGLLVTLVRAQPLITPMSWVRPRRAA